MDSADGRRWFALALALLSGCSSSRAVETTDAGVDVGNGCEPGHVGRTYLPDDASIPCTCADGGAGTFQCHDGGPFCFCEPDGGCPTDLGASCTYRGYGSGCSVPCSFPLGCHPRLHVTWSGGGYCCAEELYNDCVCNDGYIRCIAAGASPPAKGIESLCEFCDGDTGVGD